MFDLTVEPLIPGSLWLVLAVGGAALMAFYAMRRPAGINRPRWSVVVTLMSAALVLVLGLLLNPTWSRQLPPPPGKPVLTILVDASGSMATPDVDGGKTRFAAAAQVATSLESDLNQRFDVRVHAFDASTRFTTTGALASATPSGNGTDLASAINSELSEDHPQGQAIVLLSDGIDNVSPGISPILSAVRTAKSLEVPIYTQTFGGDANSIDLAVEMHSPQDMAVVGQRVLIAVRVLHKGLTTGKAIVTLSSEGKVVAQRDAVFDPTDPTDVTFQVSQEKVGIYPYEIRVEPLPGETSLDNNSAAYVLRVVNEPIRVLLLEGKPYWDGKFLTRTLMSDPAVAIDCVVRLSDTRLLRRTLSHGAETPPSSPDRVETWKIGNNPAQILADPDSLRAYQVIVLGRDAEPFLDDIAVTNLQNWVSRQGGSLLCYRGPPTSTVSDRLGRLLPVRWTPGSESRFRVALTDQGKDLNWFAYTTGGNESLPRLPSLAASSAVDSAKPLAVVLAQAVSASGAPTPAVIYQPYGAGRVMVVEGSGMWRWAFLSPDFQDQDQVYASLWHSVMRWLTSGQGLTPGQTFSLRVDKVRFGDAEPATATLLARQEISEEQLPRVQLLFDSSIEPKLFSPAPLGSEAGVYRVNFGTLPEGKYRAILSGSKPEDPNSQVAFDVRRYDKEMLDLQARPDLMARLADDSGGTVLAKFEAAAELSRQFTRHLDRAFPPRFERATAWDRWWVLLAVLGFWCLSWAVRRSGGLV